MQIVVGAARGHFRREFRRALYVAFGTDRSPPSAVTGNHQQNIRLRLVPRSETNRASVGVLMVVNLSQQS
ncbi:MAG TPA: hypothetical protein VFJ58_29350 [Armatimonadota bacterium]|nr:hypothetical protein [Armatimonadota bacterium]